MKKGKKQTVKMNRRKRVYAQLVDTDEFDDTPLLRHRSTVASRSASAVPAPAVVRSEDDVKQAESEYSRFLEDGQDSSQPEREEQLDAADESKSERMRSETVSAISDERELRRVDENAFEHSTDKTLRSLSHGRGSKDGMAVFNRLLNYMDAVKDNNDLILHWLAVSMFLCRRMCFGDAKKLLNYARSVWRITQAAKNKAYTLHFSLVIAADVACKWLFDQPMTLELYARVLEVEQPVISELEKHFEEAREGIQFYEIQLEPIIFEIK